MLPRLLSLLWLIPVVPASLKAQEAPAVPIDVEAVTAGGYWKEGSRDGQYRLIIESGGYEHIVSRVWLQWLSPPSSHDDSTSIVASVELEEINAGGWRASDPRLEPRGSQWEATIEGLNSHTRPMLKTRWHITLGSPGKYSMATE